VKMILSCARTACFLPLLARDRRTLAI
jgi:hypothetical protein